MLTVFVDESGADGRNRFLVHGALFVRHPALEPMRADVASRLATHGFPDELKWSSTSRRRLTRDIKAVSTFFDTYESDGQQSSPRYQCLVVDQHKVNARLFHDGDNDLCFYKQVYQLLLHRISRWADPAEQVHVVLDERSTRRYRVNELAAVLHYGLRKKLGAASPNVVSVRYRKSHEEPLLQVADFLTGAVMFHRNGYHLKEVRSEAKWWAAAWLAKKVGVPDLAVAQRRNDKFGIWTMRLR